MTIGPRRGKIGRAGRPGTLIVLAAACSCWGMVPAGAADLDEAEALLRSGSYEEAARMAAEAVGGFVWEERWIQLKAEAELATGADEAALASLEVGLRRFPASLPLLMMARDVFRYTGRAGEVPAVLDRIERLIRTFPDRYDTAGGRVALGRFFLLRGIDPKQVLDRFFDVAIDREPGLVDAYLASAELALEKRDDALAAETLARAPEEAADDPRYQFLLARAFSEGDRARSAEAIEAALGLNPNHADSLLLRANHLIDAEAYEQAEAVLGRVLEINSRDQQAWAFLAVIAHLTNDPEGEAEARASALDRWEENPEVDHILGRELSQKYRFAEGSAYQRRALERDPEYLPAKIQLCTDLLRLGAEEEGWALANEVFERDGYNVLAYNLVTLKGELDGYRTLEGDGFLVRMDPDEAELYGDRVLDLLGRARQTLRERYGASVEEPVVVEVFPSKNDFAVRTFGLPGADGFLGVCFGRVITAISPAAQGEDPSNWESVLWHEYCHSVTLARSKNKMPRWLSEGISVFEEGREDPSWATRIDPHSREKLLADDLTPLSGLSGAFLAPESPLDVQFAYFESALAVEFLVGLEGLEAIRGLLDDLGAGVPINDALPDRFGKSLEELDEQFLDLARSKAEAAAPGASWEVPELPPDADVEALEAWLEGHPGSIPGWRRLGLRLVDEERWERAEEALTTLKGLDPDGVGPESADALLAAVFRERDDPEAEREALQSLVSRDAGAGSALLRLIELDEEEEDWPSLADHCRAMLAVNPLIPAPHRGLARAAERLGETGDAIDAYQALATLDPTDPAEIHFRLAGLLQQEGRADEARREVLKALEEAPRFREAHRLLLELVEGEPAIPR
ncbi:tetratricopeptide repeat protein [Tautonia plasticadhaerens]|uniref:Tetratricopeptide repeat protein n=1 Tax=Tautonia plasticadhaerens TaxID=2527974 RepID=A0A518GW20_9BACT|nr:tetratricopeptide repeat protein [Tautonia plasticadhaerens]QDV32790.1 tetratricopeptide repeat protein [Tautonia plasticadhaerens]